MAEPPQSIPAGVLLTEPVPATLTLKAYEVGDCVKAAPTLRAPDIDTVQVEAVPKQAPDQPENEYPAGAVAVNVTVVPDWNEVEHDVPAAPHKMPAGWLVTVPLPVTDVLNV